MAQSGTVFPSQHTNPDDDAKALEKAMKGLGTDEQAIIDILTNRSQSQRLEIAKRYKAIYGKDLKTRLEKELSSNFRRCVLYSFYDMAHVNAKALYKAIKGIGTDEQILIDVICTSTKEEINKLKAAYNDILQEEGQNVNRRNLEKDVKSDVSGDFERTLIALLQAQRETGMNKANCEKDATDLFSAGEAIRGTDESVFITILANRSWESIKEINKSYEQAGQHDLLTAIQKETSGDFRKSLETIVGVALNKNVTLATILYNTMKGAGTHDDNLIRFIMAHSEVDLAIIKNTFYSKYQKTVADMIKGDTSGDYRKFLLGIVKD